MKKLSFYFIKCLFAVLICTVLISCEEKADPLPHYVISNVTKCERESVKMLMTYSGNTISTYNWYENDALVSSSNVKYTPGSISFTLKDVRYDIQLALTKGGFRIESMRASSGIATLYSVDYWFDKENRLEKALVNGSTLDNPHQATSVWVSYKYEGNKITTSDGGYLELSVDENVGNVCNVLDFAGSRLTSTYVINPDFYFLNIYGTPITKLPQGQTVSYNEKNQLSRVGKYYYEY